MRENRNRVLFDPAPEDCHPENSKLIIVPASYEKTTTYRKGTASGPYAIFLASQQVELYEPELDLEPYKIGIATHPPLELEGKDPKEAIKKIEEVLAGQLERGKIPILLGGEHTITLGAVRAFKRYFPEFSLLVLDAHTDLRDSYLGEKLSHACVMRRVLEEGIEPVWLGVRSLSREEAELIKAKKLRVYFSHQLRQASGFEELIVRQLKDKIYISLDVDVFDPSQVPGVGTPEPAGLFYHQVLDLFKAISLSGKEVLGMDLVELAPIEGEVVSEFTCARLLYQAVGWFWSKKIASRQN